MFRKKNSTPNLHLITDEDARRAEAQRQINRTVAKFVAVKVGVTVATLVVVKIIEKKLEASEATSSED
ncbi:hypothetical protein SEA_CLUBPENGUIN_36 [Streptomyces phage ClubPenguin]|nr:hypothetical protein SEA_CLUBPENGUIN_36 [Streptomyces phage ClubPenguin]